MKEREFGLASSIATHAILRNPIGFLDLSWSTYLDYSDGPFIHRRVSSGPRSGNSIPAKYRISPSVGFRHVIQTAVQSPVRSYFEGAWRYYGLIPAVSAILLETSLAVDRRLSTLTLAAFALASAASHIAFSTEPVPRYIIVSAWVNIVVAGRIVCVLATRRSPSEVNRPLLIR